MEKKLNTLLADLVVEYHKLQNFHWYIKGKDFFTIHAKLEEYYNYINEAIDEIAENILMIGFQPVASLKEFMELSKIEEAKDQQLSSKEIYNTVLKDFNYLLEAIKEIKQLADKEDNYLISSLMDDYIGNFTKSIWMLNQVV
ncbi:DNA starvation/stationary phase protection protein [uncultured Thomasclavelia sp.]|uniref:Dps family protein n=1 Tax=uncultured Thomasclavelia sp. TaxID=3025759 RepID=UPI0025E8F8C2|nr:DNA starvation/stationary phase protection protein [uncultured Thomasclavelia sp.]